MIQIQGEEIQKYLLETVKVLSDFCENNNLRYYLSGGSLLGAVRHQGFIPWDDDIDIMMPRKDYEVLISEFDNNTYEIVDCQTNKYYGAPYARMWDKRTVREWKNFDQISMGIYIDILPIDGYPNSEFLSVIRDYYLLYLRKWRTISLRKTITEKDRFKVLQKILKAINPHTANYYSCKANLIGKKNSFETSSFVGVQSGTYHQQKERNPKSIFDHTIYFQFEDIQLPGPAGYDEYLKHLFGNYMQLPPEDQRIGRHDQIVYLKEEGDE